MEVIQEWGALATSLIAIGTLLGMVLMFARKRVQKIAAAEITTKLEAVEKRLGERIAAIHEQVSPNHGKSMHDAINRIERGQDQMRDLITDHLRDHITHGR